VGALKIAIAATALVAAAPVHAGSVDRWRSLIAEASARFGVPVAWIERVMRAESGGYTRIDGWPITSAAGAMGLMQLMPATWAEMRVRLGLGADPYDPHDNILAGTFYLRLMYDRFGYPGLFAAYNAGPGRYAEHVMRGRPLPDETRRYLAAVTGTSMPVGGNRSAPANALFFVRHSENAVDKGTPAVETLFVQLRTSDDIIDGDDPATSR
jgi:soluble lytic murein transglycosylase-like protein